MKMKRIVSILLAVIMLLSVAPMSFAADNSTQENAIPVTLGEEISFTAEPHTEYWYSVETTKSGQFIKVESNYSRVYFYDADGNSLDYSSDGDSTEGYVYYVLTGNAGKHGIRVYHSSSAPRDYVITVTLVDNDVYEPNNTQDTAKPLTLGQEYTVVAGGADEDWFTVTTTKPGQFIVVTGDYGHIFVYTPDGVELDYARQGDALYYLTEDAGAYGICVYGGDYSADGTTFSVALVDNDAYEPNNTEKTAYELTSGVPVEFQLGYGDKDYFSIETTKAGQDVKIDFSGFNYAIEGSFYAYFDDVKIGTINSNGTYYLHATNAGKHIIELYNGKSTEQFTMTATVLDGDANEPNDTLKQATRLPIGTDKNFSMGGKGDEDWFTFESAFDEGESSKMYTLNLLDLNTDYSDLFYYDLYAPDGTLLMDGIEVEIRHNNIIACEQEGLYALCLHRTSSMSPRSDLRIRVDEGGADPYEPNDTWLTAAEVQAEQPIQFILSNTEDADWFKFEVPEAYMTMHISDVSTVAFTLYAAKDLEEFGTTKNLVTNDNYNSSNYYYQFDAPGTYYLKAYSSLEYISQDLRTLVVSLEEATAEEPNNTWKTAKPIYEGVPTSYDLTASNDYDWFVFELPAGVKKLTLSKDNCSGWHYRELYRAVDFETAGDDAAYIGRQDTDNEYYIESPVAGTYYLRCVHNFSNRYMNQRVIYHLTMEDDLPAQPIENAPTELALGSSVTLHADSICSGSVYGVTWTSSDSSVLYVTSGKVTAVGNGSATITATDISGATISVTITVTDAPAKPIVTGLTLDDYDLTLYMGEGDGQLTATVSPADSPVTVGWVSSNLKAATVDQTGKITPVAPGVTVITASAGDYRASCIVTVQPDRVNVESIAFDTAVLEIPLGGESALRPIFTPSDATVKSMTWASSDTNVASVSRTGIVNALAVGETTITATTLDGGKQASILIRVTAAPQPGDINGDGYVDAADAMITLQVAVGKVELNDAEFEAADVNGDGWVDAADAVRILRYDAGLIDSLEN